jgi:putative transposase
MYSYKDCMRAVKLYIKLGKRTSATIRQLGYPTKNALKSWHLEYEKGLDLPLGYVLSRSKYSDQQKRVAVEHYLNHDRCLTATRKALGYPCRDTLAAWVNELHPERRKSIVGKARSVPRPAELRQAAVIELCTRQTSAQAVAQRLAVDRTTLYQWKNQLLGSEAPPYMKPNNDPPPPVERAELEQQVIALQRDIRKLQLEHDLLKKATELLKKGLGVDLQLLSNRAQLSGADKYAQARLAIAEVFERNHSCYGYRRLRASLGRQQLCLSEKVVQRLMKQEGLVVSVAKRRRYGSYLGEISPAPDNLINRNFQAATPNEKWFTDITEFQIPAGKVYLSPMVDCFDGLVVSWTIGTRPDADLVNTMLDAAIERVAGSNDRPVVHSDRGGHYRWPGWLSRMHNAKLIRSMSRKGCSPDNAACEGFFGRLKTELFYPRNWQGSTIGQFIEVVDSYIRWYNEKRIKISEPRTYGINQSENSAAPPREPRP